MGGDKPCQRLWGVAVSFDPIIAGSLFAGKAGAQAVPGEEEVRTADVAGLDFVAANAFETRVVHPQWKGDRLFVEDIRFLGHYPRIAGTLPDKTLGTGILHPATMVGGILTYYARVLFGESQAQTVVFKRTSDPATRGIHARLTFDGPPEGSPDTVEAATYTEEEWRTGQTSTSGDRGGFPG